MNFETFAFLAVMFGVILSLGIASLLSAMGSMLRSWSQARPYWVYAAWLLLQLMLYLHIWWNFWSLQQAVAEWNFFLFLVLLVGPAALFMATQVLLFEPSADVDSEKHYFDVHRVFFTLLALVVIWEMATAPLFFGETDPVMGLQFVVLVVLATLATSKRRALHGGLTLVSGALFFAGVVGYGLRLMSST